MVITGEPPPETVSTLKSLQQQVSGKWSLTVVVPHTWRTTFTSLLAVSGIQRSSQKVQIDSCDDDSSVHQMVTQALRIAAGSDVALIFPGDIWTSDAVKLLSEELSPSGITYADQDSMSAEGTYHSPLLKPDYSPEFHLRYSYIGRPVALGSEVAQLAAADLQESTAVEHNLTLRACELASDIRHISEVLCHSLLPPPPLTPPLDHVAAALIRREGKGTVSRGGSPDTFRINRVASRDLQVSIVIPFRDQPRFLRNCVDSVEETRGDTKVEFILVDNGSGEPETATLLETFAQRSNIRVLADDRPFNWAQLNNAAVQEASGELLIFLNNDIEAHHPGWLDALCSQAMRPEVGAVGARLLYPDRRLQHGGVVIGLGGAAGHLLVGLEENQTGYLHMATTTRECGAVTGACLATRRDVYSKLAGFDESLGIDLNDIDYCLRAQRRGYRIIYEAEAELTHHESPSRGTAGDVRDIAHFIDRWKESILTGDPFLNANLTRQDSSCGLRRPDEVQWWEQWNENLIRS
jgi:O-antigen biosynthesis protein